MSQQQTPELEWIQMQKDFDKDRQGLETSQEKLVRKFKQNPLVPVGCLVTAGVLSYGLWSFRQGERKMSQMMMRARIVAQGVTVAALVIGVAATLTTSDSENKK